MSTIVIDVSMTAADINDSVTTYSLSFPGDEVIFYAAPDSRSTFLYPTEYAGSPIGGTAWVPATPAGYVLTDVRPIIRAYTSAAQTDIGEDTSGWGYAPPPLHYPFLVSNTSSGLSFDTFPVGSYPVDPIVCGAPAVIAYTAVDGLPDDGYHMVQRDCQIRLNYLAQRFTFTGDTPPLATVVSGRRRPLIQHPRSDGQGTSTARVLWPMPTP